MHEQTVKDLRSLDFEERGLDTKDIDPRVQGLVNSLLNKIGCTLKHVKVLDVGTFDGLHACQLAQLGAIVTASDIRPYNLQKALFRALYLNLKDITYRILDMEEMHTEIKVDEFDIIFHSGCFYHLSDPVAHLKQISKLAGYILLETHLADERYEKGSIKYENEYFGTWWNEGAWIHGRAAKDARRSFWLTVESLEQLFKDCGLEIIDTIYKDSFNPLGNRSCYLLKRI